MRYSSEPKDWIYVKGYGFLLFAKNIGKNLSNKYSKKCLDRAKKSTTDAMKTASKKEIQITAEATHDLIGNKISHKITKASKTSQSNLEAVKSEEDIPKERYISLEKNHIAIILFKV